MIKIANTIFLFHILNISLALILSNMYDWQGAYFMLGLTIYMLPNIIGLAVNFILVGLFIEKVITVNAVMKSWLIPVILFIGSEIGFLLYEKHIIFFGLLRSKTTDGINAVSQTYYILISLSAFISAFISYIRLKRGLKVKSQ